MSPSPRLSIVVASVEGDPVLERCVTSFLDQSAAGDVEVVVATSAPDSVVAPLQQLAATGPLTVLRSSRRLSIPELRALGFASARGAIIGMTEDHCVASPDWVERVLQAHRNGVAAVGGAVENGATGRLIDWAVYFCEYGRYMPPVRAGLTDDLPGPNVSYTRAAVDQFSDLLSPATWDPLWHQRLRDRGCELLLDSQLIVYHCRHFTFRGFMRERYHYSRSFAGTRLAGARASRRILFALGTPLLPVLVLWRTWQRIWPKNRHRRQFLQSLPLIALFAISWSAGEFVGYLFGPGRSAEAVV